MSQDNVIKEEDCWVIFNTNKNRDGYYVYWDQNQEERVAPWWLHGVYIAKEFLHETNDEIKTNYLYSDFIQVQQFCNYANEYFRSHKVLRDYNKPTNFEDTLPNWNVKHLRVIIQEV